MILCTIIWSLISVDIYSDGLSLSLNISVGQADATSKQKFPYC